MRERRETREEETEGEEEDEEEEESGGSRGTMNEVRGEGGETIARSNYARTIDPSR